MGKLSGGSLLLVGVILVIFGAFVQSGIMESLLNIVGFLVVALGIILGIVGLIQMFSGSAQSDY